MRLTFLLFVVLVPIVSLGETLKPELITLDERPAHQDEWGYRPSENSVSEINPPSFVWRPQQGIVHWQIQVANDDSFDDLVYNLDRHDLPVHTPSRTFAPGEYYWRYRGFDSDDRSTSWSQTRLFRIASDATVMTLPKREELLARVPTEHPRLFLRPEELPELRRLAKGSTQPLYDELVQKCERILRDPPPTAEPAKYSKDMVRGGDPWRELWWGNREYTSRALNSAAILAFTWRLDGNEQYGQLAKRILLDCAEWDPRGATGYRYNDEAGMPYAYYFARTYTFVHDLLSQQEKRLCREVMRVRGQEMFAHLYPRHLWSPYASHSNRAWHFLGEVGLAFQGEIPEAEQWVWFATNCFFAVYPVWSDQDGGWHEGSLYWSSYIRRFTWWADIMNKALRIDAYQKPYFDKIGYYPLYLMPPGKVGAGFGDLNARVESADLVPLMSVLASQARNAHWQWYVQQHDPQHAPADYVTFMRGASAKVESKPPTNLPTSRLFRGIGQAYLNTTLTNAKDDVQVVFKSSPFGTQSHGYEANNSFLLWAYGQRLLIRSGRRDQYASEHHRNWMWSTRSVNNITVDGRGQLRRSAEATGKIVDFKTSASIDVVVGEAGSAYRDSKHESLLERFTRAIIFVKPGMIVVYDRIVPRKPSEFTYWLHAVNRFDLESKSKVGLTVDDVNCEIQFLAPRNLTFAQTDQYDPNPRPRIELREWHLSATTNPRGGATEFVTVFQPYRDDETPTYDVQLESNESSYLLTATAREVSSGTVRMLLPRQDKTAMGWPNLRSEGELVVQEVNRDGESPPVTNVNMR